MLRRIVFVGVIGMLVFSSLAFSSFNPPVRLIPLLGHTAQMSQGIMTIEAAVTETVISPTTAAGGKEAITPLNELSQTETPTVEWLMLPVEDNSTPPATLIIVFNTPTSAIEEVPTAPPPQPTPEVQPTPTVPKPVVITLPAPSPTVTPVPIVLSPVPTSSPAPTIPAPPIPTSGPASTIPAPPAPGGQDIIATGVPQIIWIEDMPGLSRSKVMGWRGGTSHSLFGDKEYISRVLEFNVSPGGSWLAYTAIDHSGIQQVNTITGEQREITPKYPWWRYRFPTWSPDGALLAFVAATDSVPWVSPPGVGLWTSAPDGTGLKQVVKELGWANHKILLAGWHPLQKELIYALPGLRNGPLPQWLLAPTETGDPQPLPLLGTLYDVAPDGSWLLGDGFTTDWPEGRQGYSLNVLMHIPIDGATPKVLTPACHSDMMGQISPDGSRIAFLSMPTISLACPPVSGTITYELWIMNSDGTERRQIQVEGIIGRNSPQWSPDGSAVYYSAWDNTGSALWQADASGVAPVMKLPQTEGIDRFAVIR